MRRIETDVLVVGGGLAALRAAYDALFSGARVALAVKGKAGRSGSSAMTSAVSSRNGPPDLIVGNGRLSRASQDSRRRA